eukprot:gene14750-19829_t
MKNLLLSLQFKIRFFYIIILQIVSIKSLRLVVFTQGNLRFLDNPCLDGNPDNHDKNILPICIYDPSLTPISDLKSQTPIEYRSLAKFSSSLWLKYPKYENLTARKEISFLYGDTSAILIEIVNQLNKMNIENISVNYPSSPIGNTPITSQLWSKLNEITKVKINLIQELLNNNINHDNDVFSSSFESCYSNKDLSHLVFSNNELLDSKEQANVFDFDLLSKVMIDNSHLHHVSTSILNDDILSIDESTGIKLINEYIQNGDNYFTAKYSQAYKNLICQSKEHIQSIERLINSANNNNNNFKSFLFQGEVVSGILTPYIRLGCISTRLLYNARNIFPTGKILSPFEKCRLKSEAIRKDWHYFLATQKQHQEYIQNKNSNNLKKIESININYDNINSNQQNNWKIKFNDWRGYVQREASMIDNNNINNNNNNKPYLFLIHGFGGSINQYTSLAQELLSSFNIFAIDSLGFGQSEKPPMSYNQYLWRDQMIDFIESTVHSLHNNNSINNYYPIFIGGNSIGGYTAATTAALLNQRFHNNNKISIFCEGLILFNPSGQVINITTIDNNNNNKNNNNKNNNNNDILLSLKNKDYFPPYKGPSSTLLRLFGKLVFTLLQPRIKQTCEWLYPNNPIRVTESKLDLNILRDSCDPGAPDVIAAGGKLPPPLTMNELFSNDNYNGLVLLAQGSLDPLNDAVSRAYSFENIRNNITIDLLPLGHCPMDENP